MSRTVYTPAQKSQAQELLRSGMKIAEVSQKTGVKGQTVSNWKKELDPNGSGSNGEAKTRKRRKRTKEPAFSYEDLEHSVKLAELENDYLREMVLETDAMARMAIEIRYLRARLRIFGDVTVRPLNPSGDPTPPQGDNDDFGQR
jgi:transposase-like protein